MPQCPRRALLGSIGTTMTVALAGNAVSATDAAVQSDGDSELASVSSLLDYFPASAHSDSLMARMIDFERRREANEPTEPHPTTGPFQIDAESVSKQAIVYSTEDGYSTPINVISGDFDLGSEGETRETDGGVEYERHETDGGVEYERHETDEMVAGVTDTVAVLAEDNETIGDAFAANAGETERLLDAEPLLEEAFDLFAGDSAGYHVRIGGSYQPSNISDDVTVEYIAQALTVLGPDTIEMNTAIAFEDASNVTDELVESLKGEMSYMATIGEPEVEVDGSVVTVSVERDLEAERKVREHESPGYLQPERDVDLDDDILEIEIGRGDPTPIEDLTLEVGGEEYDRDIWADGHGTLEEGDTIVIDMDDVEPNLSIRLRHDHELGGSSSGTTILSRFQFEYDYDVDAGTLTVEYADEFPLDGEQVSIVAYDEQPTYRAREDGVEPRTTVQPWSGTMSTGDKATVEDVRPGDTVLVCWDGTTHQDSIAQFRARPPGAVEFNYDFESETLSATLRFEDEGERSADEYELLIDDEPADTQWTDEAETVTSGATIEVDDVEVGADVTAVWGEDEIHVGGTHPRPRIQLELDEDEETIEHVGGDSVPASELTLHVRAADESTEIDLDEEIDGEFAEGDTVPVDADEIQYATLRYGDVRSVGYVHPPRE
ncbi:hypothetical protein [Natrinema sp. SYSU A 869]|uniref:hypothetical protein n=1 Tax=Natrinema sp. SYSU A 869 TaxID=2871694 RepID=UPI001CA41341|nr:hypothetical protein [Natrinema sp. SYSU A 869]